MGDPTLLQFLLYPLAAATTAISAPVAIAAGVAIAATSYAIGKSCSAESERQKTRRAEINAQRDIECSKEQKEMETELQKERNTQELRKLSLNALVELAEKAKATGNYNLYKRAISEIANKQNNKPC